MLETVETEETVSGMFLGKLDDYNISKNKEKAVDSVSTVDEKLPRNRHISNTSVQEKMDWVLEELSLAYATSKELANKIGIPVEEMDRILESMEREKRIFRIPGNDAWRRA